MQIQCKVLMKSGGSLRTAIVNDLRKSKRAPLTVEQSKNMNRPKGWAKIASEDLPGVINMEWIPSQKMLMVRAIAEKGNIPHKILGVFVQYVLSRYKKKIKAINIQLQ
jgi:hypothetical protein